MCSTRWAEAVGKGAAAIESDSTDSAVVAGKKMALAQCCCLNTSAAELACTLVAVHTAASHSAKEINYKRIFGIKLTLTCGGGAPP